MSARTIATAAALLAAVGAALVAAPAVAAPAARPCVTKAEFRQLEKGMSPAAVKRITGTNGTVSMDIDVDGYRMVTRDYRVCPPYRYGSVVMVTFESEPGEALAVTGRTGYWWK